MRFAPPRPESALLSQEAARALLARATVPPGLPSRNVYYPTLDRQWRAACVAASSALALHGDPADAGAIADTLAHLRHYEDPYAQLTRDLQGSLVYILVGAGPASREVGALVAHPSAEVRAAVARALGARSKDEAAQATLAVLAADRSASVRAAARGAAPKDSLPPWYGLFTADPMPTCVAWARERSAKNPDGAEAAVRALLAEVCDAFVKGPYDARGLETKLAPRLATLPDAVVVDLARHVANLDVAPEGPSLLAAAVAREGGAELLVDLARGGSDGDRFRIVRHTTKLLAEPSLAAARSRFGALASRAALDGSAPEADRETFAELVCEILANDPETLAVWVRDAGVTSLSPSAIASVGAKLAKATRAPEALLPWAREKLADDTTFTDDSIYGFVTKLLAWLPAAERRALAERYVGADSARSRKTAQATTEAGAEADDDVDEGIDARREWALEQLVEHAYDLEACGPLPALVARLYAIEPNRRCFLGSLALVPFALPLARPALRRRELSFREANLVASAVRALAGTSLAKSPRRKPTTRPAVLAALPEKADRADLDDEEMAGYLALRADHSFAGMGIRLVDFDVIGQTGALADALVDTLVHAAGAGDKHAQLMLRIELYSRPTAALLAATRAAFRMDEADDEDEDEDDGGRGSMLYSFEHGMSLVEGTPRPSAMERAPKLTPASAGRPGDALVVATETRALVTRAIAGMDECTTDTPAVVFAHERAIIALSACASVLHGDAASLRDLADVAAEGLIEDDYLDTILHCIGELVALSRASDALVRQVAKSLDASVRTVVAESLRADEPAGRTLLLRFAADADSHVRNAAKGALGEGAVPWWVGIFGRDPTETLSDDDAVALAPTFEAIASALGPGEGERSRASTLEKDAKRLSRALPDALACDLARQLARANRDPYRLSPWVAAAVAREGGDKVLLEVLELRARERTSLLDGVSAAAKDLPEPARLPFALAVLRFAAFEPNIATTLVMQVGIDLLRPEDASALADALLEIAAADGDAFDRTCASIGPYFRRRKTLPAPLVEWALATLTTDEDDDHTDTERLARELAMRAPADRARAVALRLLAGPSKERCAWALAELTGALYDRSLDGPKAARARALFDEPSFRAAFFRDPKLLDLVLPSARAALASGTLDFQDARRVAFAIRRHEEKRANTARPGRAMTERERAAYLSARAAHRFEGAGWRLYDWDIIGTTTDLGRAHLAASLAAVEQGDELAAASLGHALFGKPDHALLETAMAMVRSYGGAGIPVMLRYGIEEAHEALGIVLEEPLPVGIEDDDD